MAIIVSINSRKSVHIAFYSCFYTWYVLCIFFSSLFRFVRWTVSFAHRRQTGQWLTVYVLFFHHSYFVCCARPQKYGCLLVRIEATISVPAAHTCDSEWNRRKPIQTKWREEKQHFFFFVKNKMNEKKVIKKRHRTLARIAQKKIKMQALHGAIWNRQNHNIDCCKFCRAVNPFARHKHTSFSSSFFFRLSTYWLADTERKRVIHNFCRTC